MVKRRWKGLCALWMVLALVVGASPVTVAAEDVPGTVEIEADSGVESREGQTQEESSEEESSSEEELETETSEIEGTETSSEGMSEGTWESSAEEDVNGETLEESAESEETTEGIEEETTEEISTEEGTSIEETSAEESIQEEGSEEGTLQATNPALLEGMALTAKTATAREAATSGAAWLYVGSGEVKEGSYVGSAGTESNDVASYREQITIQFDSSLNTQDALKNVTVPDDKKLKGWKLWGFNSSGFVTGDLGELEASGQISANNYLEDFKIDNSSLFLLIIPQWRSAKDILDEDSLEMSIGDDCILSEGTWQVDGDNTLYTVGTRGSTVYAAKNGTFIFHKK